ncbi:MAG: sugar phosphate isomerase/epimerase family protein [Cellulosilyticaceae bacterium]
MSQIAIQLYTVRDACQKDFLGTLEKVAALGFEGVELAGTFDVPASVLRDHLKKLKLTVVGSHVPLEDLKYRLDEVIAYNQVIDNKYVICPWSEMKMSYEVEELVVLFAQISEKLKASGLILGYHNHDHEMKIVDDEVLLTRFFKQLRGKVACELDTFWVHRAGFDPVGYMKQIGHQLALVHLKDGTKEELKALGEGEVDIPAIIEQSERMGIKWLVVENDAPCPTGLEDAERSMAYLKKIRG